jgi:hypothetical protein
MSSVRSRGRRANVQAFWRPISARNAGASFTPDTLGEGPDLAIAHRSRTHRSHGATAREVLHLVQNGSPRSRLSASANTSSEGGGGFIACRLHGQPVPHCRHIEARTPVVWAAGDDDPGAVEVTVDSFGKRRRARSSLPSVIFNSSTASRKNQAAAWLSALQAANSLSSDARGDPRAVPLSRDSNAMKKAN